MLAVKSIIFISFVKKKKEKSKKGINVCVQLHRELTHSG